MGKSYPSERAAIMNFLENAAAGEAGGAEAFTKWAEVCKTDCIRSGLRMVAEREAYHSRQLAQRLHEMGGECNATMSEEGRKFVSFVSNPDRSDVDKLQHLNKNFGDPGSIFKPAREFIASIKEDLETREMLRLFIEDECSTLTWLADSCKALSALAERDRHGRPPPWNKRIAERAAALAFDAASNLLPTAPEYPSYISCRRGFELLAFIRVAARGWRRAGCPPPIGIAILRSV